MLFIEYSSAFNTIVPSKLVTKLRTLGLNTCLYYWILDFLMGRTQMVRVGNITSATLTLNTGAPQGCVLSPFLYTLELCTGREFLYTPRTTPTPSSSLLTTRRWKV